MEPQSRKYRCFYADLMKGITHQWLREHNILSYKQYHLQFPNVIGPYAVSVKQDKGGNISSCTVSADIL